jgi:hypothetical protein
MPEPMEGPARTRLVALVVLLALALPLTIVAVVGSAGGDDEEVEEAGLRVERSAGVSELIVFLDPDVNKPERTGGRPSVLVECLDEAGGVVARSDEPFPFTDTDQETRDPHVHVRINPARINDVVSCRVRPADPPLAGPVV